MRVFPFAPLTGEPRRRKIFAFDTETVPGEDGEGSDFVLGNVFDGDEHYTFTDRRLMIEHLMQRRRAGMVGWASNLEYDMQALFPEPTHPVFYSYFGGILKSAKLKLNDRTVTRRDANGKTHQVNSREWVHFADTLNHWPGGVGEYGKLVGLPKLDMPDIEPSPELAEYCQRDTEIVYRLVDREQDIYNNVLGCTLMSTVASSAKDLFRRQHMDERFAFAPLPKKVLDAIRAAYYGARTENFVKGMFHNVWMGDVVSMYPYIMMFENIPLVDTRLPVSRHIKDGLEGLACVELEVSDCAYPPLPYRHDKLYFPKGKWVGVYPLNELRYACEQGARVTKVRWCLQFAKSEPVFKEYVEALFPLKAQAAAAGDRITEKTIKLFLNGLYGVFATGCNSLGIGPGWASDDDFGEKEAPLLTEELSGFRARRNRPKYPSSTNFVWPMYITAGARIMLHKLLRTYAGLYCDTDSVATFQQIVACKELGGFDLKYFTKYFEVLAPKIYSDEKHVKIKGVPKSALAIRQLWHNDGCFTTTVPMPDLDEIVDRFVYQKVSRFRESIRRGVRPLTWSWAEKHLKLTGEKRRFLKDGTSVPLDVREIIERKLTSEIDAPVPLGFWLRSGMLGAA